MSFFSQKNLYFIVGVLAGSLLLLFLVQSEISNSHDSGFHEHADFAVFINGEKMDLSADKYMSFVPCTVSSLFIPSVFAHGGEEEGELANVHLHDNNGRVIHVHAAGVTYADFFESLQMDLHNNTFTDDEANIYANTETHSLRFFINGLEVDILDSKEIRNLDQVLITYGENTRTQASIFTEMGQITNDSCIASESCSQRASAEPEACGIHEKPFLLEVIGL
ncbi:hypothetical protein COB57_02825 [Candidatus Peregrinibacteria bacterium]|nr:MAG: hypothetical protein COB57_02825 [Candidatus Peregrinibacteria bacterium]